MLELVERRCRDVEVKGCKRMGVKSLVMRWKRGAPPAAERIVDVLEQG